MSFLSFQGLIWSYAWLEMTSSCFMDLGRPCCLCVFLFLVKSTTRYSKQVIGVHLFVRFCRYSKRIRQDGGSCLCWRAELGHLQLSFNLSLSLSLKLHFLTTLYFFLNNHSSSTLYLYLYSIKNYFFIITSHQK